MGMALVSFATNGAAQSGRLKESKPRPKPGPTPIAERERRASSHKPATVVTNSPKESANEVDSSDVVHISANLVPIPASVVDTKGFAVTGLRLDDFELLIDGQPRAISEMTRADTPVRLAMLFDNSGSLDSAREFEKQAALHFFRRVMRASDEAAVYSVETESYLAQALTGDIRKLEQTIAGFGRPQGATSLFDAIVDAAAYLRPYRGRRVIVIVSDGVDTISRTDFETTIKWVLRDDCQIFVVQTGLYEGANLRALAAERRMEQLAIQTGGAVYVPKTISDLETAFQQIAADLAHQYVLSYYQSDEHRDGRFHVIDLRIKARKDVRVRARKGYYSPKGASMVSEW
ncbi:MAG: VWA domain-containing protein [Pyrinomonadaceae bacterium]